MQVILAIIGILGYINNIIWLFDNWHSLSWGFKAFELFTIIAAPLGSIMGIIHFF